jgi:hypothetical protein
VPPTGVGIGGVSAAIWLCAAMVVAAEEEEDEEDEEEEVAAGVSVELELAAWAEDVDVSAGVVVDTAEEEGDADVLLMAALLELELELAAEPDDAELLPATTVTGLVTTVCIVLALVLPVGAVLIEPSWKAGAGGGAMGNEPAGHRQEQLQPPFAAARAAAAAASSPLPPEPAMTVTAGIAAVVFDAPARPGGVKDAVLIEAMEDDDEVAAASAAAEPVPLPAITVNGPAAALSAAAVAPLIEDMEVDDETAPLLIMPVAAVPFPDPAITVTATAACGALLDGMLIIVPPGLEVPLPP